MGNKSSNEPRTVASFSLNSDPSGTPSSISFNTGAGGFEIDLESVATQAYVSIIDDYKKEFERSVEETEKQLPDTPKREIVAGLLQAYQLDAFHIMKEALLEDAIPQAITIAGAIQAVEELAYEMSGPSAVEELLDKYIDEYREQFPRLANDEAAMVYDCYNRARSDAYHSLQEAKGQSDKEKAEALEEVITSLREVAEARLNALNTTLDSEKRRKGSRR